MKFIVVFLLSSYLLVVLGLLGLIYTGELSPLYLVITILSLVAGVFMDIRGRQGLLPALVANAAMIAIFAMTLISIFVLGAPPIQELVHFLLALQAVKILTPKKTRDWLQLYLLSFFSVVASSALSVELFFAAIFLAYLFLAPWVLILLQLKEAAESAAKEQGAETPAITFSLLGLAAGTGVALFTLTLVFFVTFPRLSVRLLAETWASGSGVTGFSDLLTLGQVAEIQKSSAVAMRVTMDRTRIVQGKSLYWRGITLDLFDGQQWQRSKTVSTPLKRRGETYLIRESAINAEFPLRQSIILEPNGSAALFALGNPTTISGRLGNIYRDPLGNLRFAYPLPFEVSYEVTSGTPDAISDEPVAGSFLQLPSVDSRVIALAQEAAGITASEEQRAYSLERFLKENYHYSLEGLPQGEKDPLAAFLFAARQGNCEYFASALAVMLRSLGIRARVVNGYLGGDWNPYGEYYLVRQSDAHSWVEAYVQGRGWITLDPTPPAPQGLRKPFSAITYFIDYLQVRWYRYVVNFSFAEQHQLFTALRQPTHWFTAGLRGFSLEKIGFLPATRLGWMRILSLFLGSGLALVLLTRVFGHRGFLPKNPSNQATERYRCFLKLLGKKRSLRKSPGETPDEFSHRATTLGIACAEEITTLYQKGRFSGTQSSTELNRMDQILTQLKKAR
jgi:transglutaminase-like putative cysteine protease